MTLTQKILAAHARNLPRPWVQAGDVLQVTVDWTIASELAWNGMERTYGLLGRPRIHDKDRFFLAVDHTVDPVTLATDKRAQKLVQLSQSFAKESGIKHFYDSNRTILHTRFYRDLVRPNDVVLGADSHTSSHGGLGAVAIGLGGADIVVAMVLGTSWIEVPEAIAVEYSGTLPFGFGGKEVILRTLGLLGRNTVAMERSVEYRGDGVKQLSTDSRFAIANMTAEFGGLNGIFEADEVTAAWLAGRSDEDDPAAVLPMQAYRADPEAPYLARYRIDLQNLEPQIAKPFSPDKAAGVGELSGMPLDGLFIGACTTTEEELVLAALLLEAAGARREPNDKQIVVPGDLSIEENLRRAGLWSIYQRAGFRVDPPGCSMCLGVASRKAGKGEKWLSSQNRNYENRMGEGSLAYLASAATVENGRAALVVVRVVFSIGGRLDGIRHDHGVVASEERNEVVRFMMALTVTIVSGKIGNGSEELGTVVAARGEAARPERGDVGFYPEIEGNVWLIPYEHVQVARKALYYVRPCRRVIRVMVLKPGAIWARTIGPEVFKRPPESGVHKIVVWETLVRAFQAFVLH